MSSPIRRAFRVSKQREQRQLARYEARRHHQAAPSPVTAPTDAPVFSGVSGAFSPPAASAADRLLRKLVERRFCRMVSKTLVRHRVRTATGFPETRDPVTAGPVPMRPATPPLPPPLPALMSSFSPILTEERLPSAGKLDELPTHLFLQVLASGFLAPRDLEAVRRTCKAFKVPHPSSCHALPLPCEAARMMLATHEYEKRKSRVLGSLSVNTAHNRGQEVVTKAVDEAGPGWIERLERVVRVPAAWQGLAAAIEKRVHHRAQLASFAGRFMRLRQERALENLAALVRRSAELAGQVAAVSRSSA